MANMIDISAFWCDASGWAEMLQNLPATHWLLNIADVEPHQLV